MKRILILAALLSFSLPLKAQQAPPPGTDNPEANQQAPADLYDGHELEPSSEGAKGVRAPNSGDLPYTDDEIQNNAPENTKTKNMPVDQD